MSPALHNTKKEGGIALIHKNQYPVQELEKGNTTTMEYAVWKVEIRNKLLQVIGIYHHPHQTLRIIQHNMFLDEITELLTSLIPKYTIL